MGVIGDLYGKGKVLFYEIFERIVKIFIKTQNLDIK